MQLILTRGSAPENLVLVLAGLRHRALELLLAVEERSERQLQRRALRQLDERALSDLGLSAADVEREALHTS